MKIEKINENQIRCTLTKEDLDSHQIRISELAYGTEKAKRLFRDMMQQAQIQFGFEADNIPLIIEAVPVSNECIMLIVTKVEDPEELEVSLLRADEEEGEPILSAITDTEELEAVYQLMMDQLYEDEEDQES